MDRREYLGRMAALGASALAGCTGSNVPDIGGTETDVAAPGTPVLAERSFEVVGKGCGTETNEASVSFGRKVTVTGTITGSDACKTARLAAAEFRDGAFRVVVETADEEGSADVCAQCLTEIDYEATFEFDGNAPGTVIVEHEWAGGRTTVATASN